MEICASDLAAYIFGCSDSKEVKTNEECTTKNIAICYCTGEKCEPEDPINSANNIGTQATFGIAVFLAFFNKFLAWIIAPGILIMLSSPLKEVFHFLPIWSINMIHIFNHWQSKDWFETNVPL